MKCAGVLLLLTGFSCFGVAQSSADVTANADSMLAIQLQSQLAAQSQSQVPVVARTAPTTNPDISAIGDFRSSYTSLGKRNIEMYLNELELQVASVVDPYARAEFLFSFGKDLNTGELGIELEVATLTSLSLPYQLQAVLGKFKPQVGKVNTLHPHYFDFVDFPRMINNFFDSEGMFMEGVSVNWLISNPFDFYQELVFEVGRVGSEPNASFVQGQTDRLLYTGHLKNFFDLTENSTLEIGLSALTGPNKYGFSTNIADIDLTYKWKPVQFNTYNSFTWQTEGLISRSDTAAGIAIQSFGAYSLMEYQIEKRAFVGARFDYSGLPAVGKSDERVVSLLLRFQPSEFQILALELQNVNRNYAPSFQQIVFRVIFGIGTHAAHPY